MNDLIARLRYNAKASKHATVLAEAAMAVDCAEAADALEAQAKVVEAARKASAYMHANGMGQWTSAKKIDIALAALDAIHSTLDTSHAPCNNGDESAGDPSRRP